ncbi:MAG TPA: hypothetical protein VHB79_04230 [Polyangiaceae bacterium]|nr:hypothetical protein [Polyangiaceae bacterium]
MRPRWSAALLFAATGCARLLGFEDSYERRSADGEAGQATNDVGDGGAGAQGGTGAAVHAGSTNGGKTTTNGGSGKGGTTSGGSTTTSGGTESTGGNGSPPSRLVLKRIAAGESHACGIRTSGELVCWGGFYAETATAPSGSFSEIACGAEASCALDADGYATCWGAFPGDLAQPPNVALTAISVGNSTACGVRASDQALVCWGPSAPAKPPAGKFSAVSLGSDFGCALTNEGAIVCWDSGLGAEPSGKFSDISAGSAHACALGSASGTVTCWGADESGEAAAVNGVFQSVVAGGSTSCGLKGGAIVCWGYDRGAPPKGSFAQLALGYDFGCALDGSGHVQCWGDTSYGGDQPPSE